jgi:hypothetical protein
MKYERSEIVPGTLSRERLPDHDRAITSTGMPTLAKSYVMRATAGTCRTHP